MFDTLETMCTKTHYSIENKQPYEFILDVIRQSLFFVFPINPVTKVFKWVGGTSSTWPWYLGAHINPGSQKKCFQMSFFLCFFLDSKTKIPNQIFQVLDSVAFKGFQHKIK